ncbi:MAG: hypothetical protein AAGA48_28805 [Myxococcota bacterium]
MALIWFLGCGGGLFEFELPWQNDDETLDDVPVGSDIGERLPDVPLTDQDGQPFVISELGGDPGVIEIFSLWAAPSWESLQVGYEQEYEGVARVVFVVQDAVSRPADQDDVDALVEGFGPLEAVWDPTGEATQLLGGRSVPWYWVLEPDGVVFDAGPDILVLLDDYDQAR